MIDLDAIKMACSSLDEFSNAYSEVFRALPPEMGKQFNDICDTYFGKYGIEGAFERMKNRSVAQIFAEYQHEIVNVIASGEVEGVQFILTKQIAKETADDEGVDVKDK